MPPVTTCSNESGDRGSGSDPSRRPRGAGRPRSAQGCWLDTETTSPVMKVGVLAGQKDDDIGHFPGLGRPPEDLPLRLSSSSSSSAITLLKKGWWGQARRPALTRTL